MRIEMVKFKSGERYPFLLQEDGTPDFWVTHFVTQKLRKNSAARTIEGYLTNIRHLKKWEQINDRDLLEEIYEGKVPNREDIKRILEHCYLRSTSLEIDKASKVVDMSKYSSSTVEDLPTISRGQYVTRIGHITDYLHFIGQERVKHKPTATMLFDQLDKMSKLLKSGLPKSRARKLKFDRSTIPDDAFEDFVSVADPYSKYNPFKNKAVRFRNYLIVQILNETGFRVGEVVGLQIGDIGQDIDKPTLTVERRHDNEHDPRKREPTAKTKGRSNQISKELRDLLMDYVKYCRSQTNLFHTHPYIFVSHKDKQGSYESGTPITTQTVTDLFSLIRQANPERFMGITPHQFRHYFNHRLSKQLDDKRREIRQEVERLEREGLHISARQYAEENGITDQRELEIRAELNGHTNVSSGEHYLKRTTRLRAEEANRQVLEKLANKLKG
ncbi:tyrosine-type recombinase/integrase [Marinomonas sp.]|jgi:integrase|uniref:tyrosine-type recombinase/integrase n=1 Tax=Marinomonas sp. TaxID=1904862 RepID=UPI003A8DBFD0